MQAKLTVVGGTHAGKSIRPKLPAVLGRGQGATVKLPYALVSRQHCEIRAEGDRLFVRDLGSTNGTLVDNQKISETELRSGCTLTVGTVTFCVEALESPKADPKGRFKLNDARGSKREKRGDRKTSNERLRQVANQSAAPAAAGRPTDPVPTIDFVPADLSAEADEGNQESDPSVVLQTVADGSVSSDSILLNPDKYLPPPAAAPPSIPLPSPYATPPNSSPAPVARTPVQPSMQAPVARLATVIGTNVGTAAPVAALVAVPVSSAAPTATSAVSPSVPAPTASPAANLIENRPAMPSTESGAGGERSAENDDDGLAAFLKSLHR